MVRMALLILILATVAGALMPSDIKPTDPALSETIRVQTFKSSRNHAQEIGFDTGEIILSRAFDGHFYANVQVNGATVNFMIDTGASGIALTMPDARRAGLSLNGDAQVVGNGAGGQVWGHVVRLNRVELGVQSVSDTPAVVLLGGEQSLLGQSFLSQFGSVEIRGDTMILR